jgi:serine/threonine protein kinase
MPESLDLAIGEAVVSWMDNIYRIVKHLGRGGSANTYLGLCLTGRHKGLHLAVKAFRTASKPDRMLNFMREIHVLRSCEHPAIMKVFDEGIVREKYPFVVAEFLPRTLHHVIRTRLGFPDKVSYSLHLLSALDYLQRLDPPVIHRDIKPKNIFVKGCSCILGDFGLLKHSPVVADDRTIVKASPGPGMPRSYRTPDLVDYLKNGRPLTPASDVFQLGLVLAELFTGSNPETPMKQNRFGDDVKLAPLGDPRHPLWPLVKDAIQGMLDFNPDTRPSPGALIPTFVDLYLAEVQNQDPRRNRLRRP